MNASERLVKEVDHLSRMIDGRIPILGSFVIEHVPEGDPPLEIRELWVGREVPIRYRGAIDEDRIDVMPADIVASLLAQREESAADWFDKTIRVNPWRKYTPYWHFNLASGNPMLQDSKVSSPIYYLGLASKWHDESSSQQPKRNIVRTIAETVADGGYNLLSPKNE